MLAYWELVPEYTTTILLTERNKTVDNDNLKNYMSQNDMILDYMLKNGSITTWDATRLGVTRLSARIWDLRHKRGYMIDSKQVKSKNRYGRPVTYGSYFIVNEPKSSNT